jgi:hypothetical protein
LVTVPALIDRRPPHRLHRKRRSSCRAVASSDPMSRNAAWTLICATWPQRAENQAKFADGKQPSELIAPGLYSVMGAATFSPAPTPQPCRRGLEQSYIAFAPLMPPCCCSEARWRI